MHENLIQIKKKLYLSDSNLENILIEIDDYIHLYKSYDFFFYNLKGLILHKNSKFKDAIKNFLRSIEINDNFFEAKMNLSVCLCDIGYYDQANEIYYNFIIKNKSYIDMKVLFSNLQIELANLFLNNDHENLANEQYQNATNILDDLDIKLLFAESLILTKEFEKAKDNLEILVNDYPDNYTARNLLGLAYYNMSEKYLAKLQFEKSCFLNPNDNISKSYMDLCSV